MDNDCVLSNPQGSFHLTATNNNNSAVRTINPPNTNARGSQLYTATQDGGTLYSTISFHVDEFKFFKIIRNVLA
jgi:hypothetical protein